MKKISFVIPTYRNKILLKNCLEALNHQKGYGADDYEVIVADDGSDDETYEYIKGVNRNYELKYIYLERCADSCRARARNRGLEKAGGEIVAFIDSDIMVKENHISEIHRCFSWCDEITLIGNRIILEEDIPYDMVCDRERFAGHISQNKKVKYLEEMYFIYYKFSYNPNCFPNPWIHVRTCNTVVLKKHLERIGGFDENFKGWGVEDIDLGYRLYASGIRIIFNNKMSVFHQRHIPPEDLASKKIKEEEHEINSQYFLEKYRGAFDTTSKDEFYLMPGIKGHSPGGEKEGIVHREVLDFKSKDSLDEIKERVLALSGDKGNKITVNDFVEDTDLDIWIQALGRRNSTPMYFPMSRMRETGSQLRKATLG